MNIKYVIMSVLLLTTFTSCGDFLKEYSTDQRYCETPEDLNMLLIGEGYVKTNSIGSLYSQETMTKSNLESVTNAPNFPWLHVLDDDSEEFAVDYVDTNKGTPLYMFGGLHNWGADPFRNILNTQWKDVMWEKMYKLIGAVNSIIFQGEELKDKEKTDVEKDLLNHVIGEAYFLRAYYYYYLTNIYGLPYRKATASTDFSVPLKTTEVIEDKYFTRATNQQVYAQIWDDLCKADGYLANYSSTSVIRANIGAVKTLKSRIALYMENYQEALDATDGFENWNYKLTDLTHFDMSSNFIGRSVPEMIFTMGGPIVPAVFIDDHLSDWNGDDNRASSFKASTDLIDSYQPNDLRYKAFFRKSTTNKVPLPEKYKTWADYNSKETVSDIFIIRYAEVYLNRAEAQAMLGLTEEARQTLQSLRSKRQTNSSISDIPTSAKELIDFIRAERRRELCFEGQRWFDLRRYSVNSKYPLPEIFCIKHPAYTYDATSNIHHLAGFYQLNAYDQDQAAWVIPIPNATIEFNRGSLTNLVRPVRDMIKQ